MRYLFQFVNAEKKYTEKKNFTPAKCVKENPHTETTKDTKLIFIFCVFFSCAFCQINCFFKYCHPI